MVEGDDNSKQGLKPSLLHGEENKNQMQSHDIIKEDDEYYEDEELSLSISADNRSGIDFDPDESVKSKRSKNNIFIQDE